MAVSFSESIEISEQQGCSPPFKTRFNKVIQGVLKMAHNIYIT
jgi:hypothetical protein